MKKLTILKGLPGAGKSTLARKIVTEQTAVRVNKDAIREMLHFGGVYMPNESLVKKIELAAAKICLEEDRHVVVDDTNLGSLYDWERMAHRFDLKDGNFILHQVSTDTLKSIIQYQEREKKNLFKRIFGPIAILGMRIFI